MRFDQNWQEQLKEGNDPTFEGCFFAPTGYSDQPKDPSRRNFSFPSLTDRDWRKEKPLPPLWSFVLESPEDTEITGEIETQGYGLTTLEVIELLAQEGDGLTNYALGATLRLLSSTKKLMANMFPHGYVVSDDEGGIRIEWIRPRREVRLMIPANQQDRHYIYYESGSNYDAVEVSPSNLAYWLDWLVANEFPRDIF